jgi:phosphoglycolate phosphatase
MNAAFEAHAYPKPDAEAVRMVVGLPLHVAMGRLLPDAEADVPKKLASSYIEAFHSLREKGEVADPLYPGVLDILTVLEDAGWILGIATGKGRRGLLATLETHDLVERFQTLQTSDTAPGKPNPGMLLNAMGETGADPKGTVMIGDTTFDMEMAVAAGTLAVGVSWGYHPEEHLHKAGAHVVIDDFAALPGELKSLGGAPS